jgi:hypothetical protein
MMCVRVLLAMFLCVAVLGCNQAQRLSQLQLGMSKADAAYVIGRYTVRGAVQNRFGQQIEVWEVVLSQPKTGRQIVNGVAVTTLT